MARRCQVLEEKVVLFSAEIERLRSSTSKTETDYEGSIKKLAEY